MMTLEQFEKHVFDTASYFTAVRFKTRGQSKRVEFPSYHKAIQYAKTFIDGRTMIYAVNGDGRSVHVVTHHSFE